MDRVWSAAWHWINRKWIIWFYQVSQIFRFVTGNSAFWTPLFFQPILGCLDTMQQFNTLSCLRHQYLLSKSSMNCSRLEKSRIQQPLSALLHHEDERYRVSFGVSKKGMSSKEDVLGKSGSKFFQLFARRCNITFFSFPISEKTWIGCVDIYCPLFVEVWLSQSLYAIIHHGLERLYLKI